MSSTKIKAYSYIRMSTKEQLRGDSLRRQLQKTEAYAKELGLDLDQEFHDHGVSAFRGKNAETGALARFRDAASKGEIAQGSHLIIESMDRLSRQRAIDAIAVLNEIISFGITVVTLDDKQKYSTETLTTNHYQLFIAIGAMVRAHDESRRKSELLADAWQQKRVDLRGSQKILTRKIPGWLKVSDNGQSIEVIEERAAVVRKIFDMASNGYGMYSIATYLNEKKVRSWGTPKRNSVRKKAPSSDMSMWRESYLKKLIRNIAVIGKFQPHKVAIDEAGNKRLIPDGEPVQNYYPAIIDEEAFLHAQMCMESRRILGKGRKGKKFSNLLTGSLFCNRCGSSMRYIDKGKLPKGGQYLRCSRSLTKGGCIPISYRYAPVEQITLTALESFDPLESMKGLPIEQQLRGLRQALQMNSIDLDACLRKISMISDSLEQDSGPTPATTLDRLRQLELEKHSIEKEINSLNVKIATITASDPATRKESIKALIASIKDEPDEEKRIDIRRSISEQIRHIVEAIIISPAQRLVHEITEDDPNWKETYDVETEEQLRKQLTPLSFDLNIIYRNGNQQFVSASDMKTQTLQWSRRFRQVKMISSIPEDVASQP